MPGGCSPDAVPLTASSLQTFAGDDKAIITSSIELHQCWGGPQRYSHLLLNVIAIMKFGNDVSIWVVIHHDYYHVSLLLIIYYF